MSASPAHSHSSCDAPTRLTNPLVATTSLDSRTSEWMKSSAASAAKRARSDDGTRSIAASQEKFAGAAASREELAGGALERRRHSMLGVTQRKNSAAPQRHHLVGMRQRRRDFTAVAVFRALFDGRSVKGRGNFVDDHRQLRTVKVAPHLH